MEYQSFFFRFREDSNSSIDFSKMLDTLKHNMDSGDTIFWELQDEGHLYKHVDLDFPNNRKRLTVYYRGKSLFTYDGSKVKVRKILRSFDTEYNLFINGKIHSRIIVS